MCIHSIEVILKQNYSPHQNVFNGMWHATYTQINEGDSWLLMLDSWIHNLTISPSFGHNLCFKYPNGECEPILDIYGPKDFQWYN
jgi:hypothetical protein